MTSPLLVGCESHPPHSSNTSAALFERQKESIVNLLLYLKGKWLMESTIIWYSKVLRQLAKYVDLDVPQDVKLFVANKKVKDSRKEVLINIYNCYIKWKGLTWERPIYRRARALLPHLALTCFIFNVLPLYLKFF